MDSNKAAAILHVGFEAVLDVRAPALIRRVVVEYDDTVLTPDRVELRVVAIFWWSGKYVCIE